MTLPDAVRAALDDEPPLDRIALGGEDELIVTPTRLLRYRGEGLLSDESVESFPYDAERISGSRGRRTATISLRYADGERSFSVPAARLEDALRPLLDGVLSAAGVTDEGEGTVETFRFDELTVVVTDRRLVEHVGEAVWTGEHEEIPFEGVTGLEVERGRHVTGVVLTADGRRHRLKVRNERADAFETCLRRAIRAYHGVESLDELADEEGENDGRSDDRPLESVDPLVIEGSEDGPEVDGHAVVGPDPEGSAAPGSREPTIEAELEALAGAIERQEALLEEQRRALERIRGVTRARGR